MLCARTKRALNSTQLNSTLRRQAEPSTAEQSGISNLNAKATQASNARPTLLAAHQQDEPRIKQRAATSAYQRR